MWPCTYKSGTWVSLVLDANVWTPNTVRKGMFVYYLRPGTAAVGSVCLWDVIEESFGELRQLVCQEGRPLFCAVVRTRLGVNSQPLSSACATGAAALNLLTSRWCLRCVRHGSGLCSSVGFDSVEILLLLSARKKQMKNWVNGNPDPTLHFGDNCTSSEDSSRKSEILKLKLTSN